MRGIIYIRGSVDQDLLNSVKSKEVDYEPESISNIISTYEKISEEEENIKKEEEYESIKKEEEFESVQKEDEDKDKEVRKATSMTSEETHGGHEATNSIKDSPSISEMGEEERESLEVEKREDGEEEKKGEEDFLEGEDGKGKEKSKKKSLEGDKVEKEGEEEGKKREEGKKEGKKEEGDKVEEDLEKKEDLKKESLERGKEDEKGRESDRERQDKSVVSHKIIVTSKQLRIALYRVIETLAETSVGEKEGSEKLSMKKLIKRTMDKRPWERCKIDHIREDIMIILDDSGSMSWWSNQIQSISTLCIRRKDVILAYEPNFSIAMNEKFILLKSGEYPIMGLNIIAVGDFDGTASLMTLADRGARVTWYCPEARYNEPYEHSWCSNISLRDVHKKIQFFRCITLFDLLRAMKATRKRW